MFWHDVFNLFKFNLFNSYFKEAQIFVAISYDVVCMFAGSVFSWRDLFTFVIVEDIWMF